MCIPWNKRSKTNTYIRTREHTAKQHIFCMGTYRQTNIKRKKITQTGPGGLYNLFTAPVRIYYVLVVKTNGDNDLPPPFFVYESIGSACGHQGTP